MNVHRSVITRLESGKYHDNVGLVHILEIADALNMDFELFFRY